MKINLSDAAAKAVVKAGTIPVTKSVQRVSRIQDSPNSGGAQIALASILWTWTKNSNESLYHATAFLADPTTGVADPTQVVTVYSASGFRSGNAGTRELRWIAVVGGVWQLLDTYYEPTGPEILEKLSISSESTAVNVTTSNKSINSATGAVTGSVTAAGTVTLALSENNQQNTGVVVVTDITSTEQGALGVETHKLSASFSGTSAAFNATAETSPVTVLTGITVWKADRISTITARDPS